MSDVENRTPHPTPRAAPPARKRKHETPEADAPRLGLSAFRTVSVGEPNAEANAVMDAVPLVKRVGQGEGRRHSAPPDGPPIQRFPHRPSKRLRPRPRPPRLWVE